MTLPIETESQIIYGITLLSNKLKLIPYSFRISSALWLSQRTGDKVAGSRRGRYSGGTWPTHLPMWLGSAMISHVAGLRSPSPTQTCDLIMRKACMKPKGEKSIFPCLLISLIGKTLNFRFKYWMFFFLLDLFHLCSSLLSEKKMYFFIWSNIVISQESRVDIVNAINDISEGSRRREMQSDHGNLKHVHYI